MAEPYVHCPCSLALDAIAVDGPSGRLTAYTCEHCDAPCTERRCPLCANLYRAATPGGR